jgi:diguanylate cyclase (GGDEF)-like protein
MARLNQAKPSSGKRILLIDDQESYTAVIASLLIREGHEVVTASSGEEGLNLLRRQQFDLLLLDFYMPGGITGEDVVTELRKFNPYIQVILQTGYAGDYPPREMLQRLDIQGFHDKTEGPDKLLLWVDVGLKIAYATQLLYKSSRGLRYILDITPELHKIQPLEDLLQGILWQISGLLGADNSFLAVVSEKSNSSKLSQEPEGFLAMVEEETGLIIKAATGRFTNQIKVDELKSINIQLIYAALQKEQVEVTAGSTMIPLRVGELVLGLIYLDQGIDRKEDQELLQIFANQAAVAIQNTRLYSMATLDPLTGVYVRRFLEQWLIRELRTAFRLQQPLSMLMFDLDDFKMINDTAGHLIGDQALTMTGKVLRQATRNTDFVGRYGGDEFIILLPMTTMESAELVGKRILNYLNEKSVLGPNGPIQLKASIGLGCIGFPVFHSQERQLSISQDYFETMAHALVRQSDEMLYMAKRSGGNCMQVGNILEWENGN